MMRRIVSTVLATLLVAGLASTPAYADAGPTVSITTQSGTVKGKVTVSATAATDPTGTATLSYAGIKITGIASYDVTLANASYQGSAHTFGTSGVSDYYWYAPSPSYNFSFDTTKWPTGSYQVTVFTEDSNGRAAGSTPITLTIPVAPTLVLSATQILVGANSTFTVKYSGTNSLSNGTLVLQQSTDPQGTWNTIASFTGPVPLLKASALVNLGDYVRALFSGATNLLDSQTDAIQILATPKLICKIATSGKVGTKLRGTCTSNINLPNVYVELQTSTGGSWTVLGGGNVSGKSIPINVTPKKKGLLYVSMTSPGIDGKLGQFASAPIKITVT